jgi:D-inositol-3-phosphate glycosyltransferase
MRITIVGPLPPVRGGIAAHTHGAMDALRVTGHDVNAIGYKRLYPRWVTGMRPGDGRGATPMADCTEMDSLAPSSWWRAAGEVRRRSPDVIVAQYWTPVSAVALGVVLARAGRAVRLVVFHNIDPHEPIPGALGLARWLFSRCDGAIFHSRYVRDRAIAVGCGVPSAVVPVPLLVTGGPKTGRPPPELSVTRSRGAPLFVCPGHLRSYKGLRSLAEAWRRVASATDARLVVAGEWLASRSDLRALRALGPRVVLIPRYLEEEELVWLLSNAEAVVLPYVSASQSGLLPMALRLARHVVLSDAGGLCEGLPSVGRTSSVTVVPAGDLGALSGAIAERVRRSSTPAPFCAYGASRHRAAIRESERRNSWRPFVSAVLGLAESARPHPQASNSSGDSSSETCGEGGRREDSPFPWYHRPSPAR